MENSSVEFLFYHFIMRELVRVNQSDPVCCSLQDPTIMNRCIQAAFYGGQGIINSYFEGKKMILWLSVTCNVFTCT